MDSILKKYLKGDAVLWAVFIKLYFISVIDVQRLARLLLKQLTICPILRHVLFLIEEQSSHFWFI